MPAADIDKLFFLINGYKFQDRHIAVEQKLYFQHTRLLKKLTLFELTAFFITTIKMHQIKHDLVMTSSRKIQFHSSCNNLITIKYFQ